MSPQQLPPDYEDLDFRMIEEKWNEYELQGGYMVKGRTILLKVMMVYRQQGQTQIGTATQETFVVTSAPGNRGIPSPLRQEEISGRVNVTRRPLRIDRNNEPWNIYELPRTGDRIRTRLMVTDMFVVENRYDNFGYPAFIVQSGVITNIEKGKRSSTNCLIFLEIFCVIDKGANLRQSGLFVIILHTATSLSMITLHYFII